MVEGPQELSTQRIQLQVRLVVSLFAGNELWYCKVASSLELPSNLIMLLGVPIKVNAADQPMGSNECASGVPFPDSAEDVSMESGTDKRSRSHRTPPLSLKGSL